MDGKQKNDFLNSLPRIPASIIVLVAILGMLFVYIAERFSIEQAMFAFGVLLGAPFGAFCVYRFIILASNEI